MDEHYEQGIENPYGSPESLGQLGICKALSTLSFFSSSLDLINQATNLSIIDEYITGLEYEYLRSRFADTHTTYQAAFLSAQSQMWIFSAYEVMRTWQAKIKDYIKASDTGGLNCKLKELQKPLSYENPTIQRKITELSILIQKPEVITKLRHDLKRTQMLFTRMELVRVQLAKHEFRGKPKASTVLPTVGHMNKWCGSLDFQINRGQSIICNISRRDIADDIRVIPYLVPPTDEELSSFESAMRGIGDESLDNLFGDQSQI